MKSKVPPKREPVPLDVAKKVLGNLENPPKQKVYPQTLVKTHKQINQKCGKTIPQLGTQQKELEPLRAPRMPDLHEAQFLAKTGLTLEQARGYRRISLSLPLLLHTSIENLLSLRNRR